MHVNANRQCHFAANCRIDSVVETKDTVFPLLFENEYFCFNILRRRPAPVGPAAQSYLVSCPATAKQNVRQHRKSFGCHVENEACKMVCALLSREVRMCVRGHRGRTGMRRKEQNLSVRITQSCVIFPPSALPFGSAATVLTVCRNQTTPRDVKFL